jgi:esterase/lipase superfamily enzyme
VKVLEDVLREKLDTLAALKRESLTMWQHREWHSVYEFEAIEAKIKEVEDQISELRDTISMGGYHKA